jgi:hypothetical protein
MACLRPRLPTVCLQRSPANSSQSCNYTPYLRKSYSINGSLTVSKWAQKIQSSTSTPFVCLKRTSKKIWKETCMASMLDGVPTGRAMLPQRHEALPAAVMSLGCKFAQSAGRYSMLMAASRLDELTPNTLPRMRTAGSSTKRKGDFHSPMPKKVSRPEGTIGITRQKPNATEGLQYVHCNERRRRLSIGEDTDSLSEPSHSQSARTLGRL